MLEFTLSATVYMRKRTLYNNVNKNRQYQWTSGKGFRDKGSWLESSHLLFCQAVTALQVKKTECRQMLTAHLSKPDLCGSISNKSTNFD